MRIKSSTTFTYLRKNFKELYIQNITIVDSKKTQEGVYLITREGAVLQGQVDEKL